MRRWGKKLSYKKGIVVEPAKAHPDPILLAFWVYEEMTLPSPWEGPCD